MWLKAWHFYTSGDNERGPEVNPNSRPVSVSASQRIHSVSITKINPLRLFMQLIVVYSTKHKKHTNIKILVIWFVIPCSCFWQTPTFRMNMLPPSSRLNCTGLGINGYIRKLRRMWLWDAGEREEGKEPGLSQSEEMTKWSAVICPRHYTASQTRRPRS
jgi:hypothetical protein